MKFGLKNIYKDNAITDSGISGSKKSFNVKILLAQDKPTPKPTNKELL